MASAYSACILSALGGVTAHLFVFRVGEHDVSSPSIFVGHVIALASVAAASNSLYQVQFGEVARCAGFYAAGLYTSMLLYRAFFHRLSGYPGPFLARLSNFYITARSVKKLHLFEEVQKLHAQYGDYVRLGTSSSSGSPKGFTTHCSQVLPNSPSQTLKLCRLSTIPNLRHRKGHGTHFSSHGHRSSWLATRPNMRVAERCGIKDSAQKVHQKVS